MDRPRKGRTGGRPQRGKTPEGAGFKLQRSAGTEKLRWPMRLNKYIAASGVCARRVAAELVKNGKVKVNGQTIIEPFQMVSETDVVEVNGREVRPSENLVYILLNKPKNYLCTSADERGRHSVLELIREPGVERLFTVGRLDRNTTGLLLLTNDGEMAQRLSHPRNRVSKIYTVELNKPVTERDMQRIADGLMLEDGRAEVDALAWPDPTNRKEVILELHSGKNRIVRRIFESLGYEIYRLDRTGYAGLTKKDLPRGRYRHLADREVIMLRHFTGRVRNLDESQETGAQERGPERRPHGPAQRPEQPGRDSRGARPAPLSRFANENPRAPERQRAESAKARPEMKARPENRTVEAKPAPRVVEAKPAPAQAKARPVEKVEIRKAQGTPEKKVAKTRAAEEKTMIAKAPAAAATPVIESKPTSPKAAPKAKPVEVEKAKPESKVAKTKAEPKAKTGPEAPSPESKATPAKTKAAPKAKTVTEEKTAAETKPVQAKAAPKAKAAEEKAATAKPKAAPKSKTTTEEKAKPESKVAKTKAEPKAKTGPEAPSPESKATPAKTKAAPKAKAAEEKAATAKPKAAPKAKAATEEKAKPETKAAKTKAPTGKEAPVTKAKGTSKTNTSADEKTATVTKPVKAKAEPKPAVAKEAKATKASAKGKSDKKEN